MPLCRGDTGELLGERAKGVGEVPTGEAVVLGDGFDDVPVGVPVVVGEPAQFGTDAGRVAMGAEDGRVGLQGAARETELAGVGRCDDSVVAAAVWRAASWRSQAAASPVVRTWSRSMPASVGSAGCVAVIADSFVR
jgi:hypothetical protein